MVGKSHDAQALTLCLLQAYDPLNRKAVYDSARKSLSDNDSALRQLELCYMLSGELDDDPAKYNNFTDLAKTILARQSPSKKKITKKDVGLTLGVNKSSANNIVDRIHDNARELSPDELLSLCEGFTEESDRFFWENQIYHLLPYLQIQNVSSGPIFDSLSAVWNSMTGDEQKTTKATLLTYAAWFDQLEHRSDYPELTSDKGLYDILDIFRKRAHVKLTDIYIQINIHPDTYNTYRQLWIEFEANGCVGPYPKNHLSRDRLLFLSFFLNMDFYTTVGILAIAGYCFRAKEPDKTLAEYLFDRRHSKESVRKLIDWNLNYRVK